MGVREEDWVGIRVKSKGKRSRSESVKVTVKIRVQIWHTCSVLRHHVMQRHRVACTGTALHHVDTDSNPDLDMDLDLDLHVFSLKWQNVL